MNISSITDRSSSRIYIAESNKNSSYTEKQKMDFSELLSAFQNKQTKKMISKCDSKLKSQSDYNEANDKNEAAKTAMNISTSYLIDRYV